MTRLFFYVAAVALDVPIAPAADMHLGVEVVEQVVVGGGQQEAGAGPRAELADVEGDHFRQRAVEVLAGPGSGNVSHLARPVVLCRLEELLSGVHHEGTTSSYRLVDRLPAEDQQQRLLFRLDGQPLSVRIEQG